MFNRRFYTTTPRPGYPVLIDLNNPAPREHDGTYNNSFFFRGNLTTQSVPRKTVTRGYDIAGNVRSASDGNLNVSAATGSATNYGVPTAITPNGNVNLGATYTYNGSLELTGVTMPNVATSSTSYTGGG